MNGQLHHIEIYVKDIAVSKVFYEWLLPKLNYHLYQEWDEGFSFKLNSTYIVFVQVSVEFKDFGYHRKQIGLNHLAFSVDSREAVDHFTLDLKKKGIPVLYDNKHPYASGNDSYAVYFEDPDRIKLEIVSEI
ncbi:VOC family protein [Mammaliicoccus stepanovicii]|uniref:Putative lyase n=1 Tax=Mammaliicoccus stepanovicii TaxID=643214 RepID=A0A239ZW73_9STAP|nr:VOC family protein [Mammaliicoccus stepanovicii]PNZ77407.1 hypothetical protein CD111_04370 [Mammaliicoccus stepanovicii]GGI39091.1 hypothetical protein GCM10010896_01650 [Mammaliicoccus stepanovicii]SNV75229.1 putative lyase [Mammaliicoccus stepanovicii]